MRWFAKTEPNKTVDFLRRNDKAVGAVHTKITETIWNRSKTKIRNFSQRNCPETPTLLPRNTWVRQSPGQSSLCYRVEAQVNPQNLNNSRFGRVPIFTWAIEVDWTAPTTTAHGPTNRGYRQNWGKNERSKISETRPKFRWRRESQGN